MVSMIDTTSPTQYTGIHVPCATARPPKTATTPMARSHGLCWLVNVEPSRFDLRLPPAAGSAGFRSEARSP